MLLFIKIDRFGAHCLNLISYIFQIKPYVFDQYNIYSTMPKDKNIRLIKYKKTTKKEVTYSPISQPSETQLYRYYRKNLTKDIVGLFSSFFSCVDEFDHKLSLAFLSTIPYFQSAHIKLYFDHHDSPNPKNLVVIHSSIGSFIFRDCSIRYIEGKVYHLCLPTEDIHSCFILVVRYLSILLSKNKNKLNWVIKKAYRKDSFDEKPCLSQKESWSSDDERKIAICYHKSTNYGKLYTKSHYFNEKENSLLNSANIVPFVLFSQRKNERNVIPIESNITLNSKLNCLWKVLKCDFRSILKHEPQSTIAGYIFITLFTYRFLLYQNKFRNSNLLHVIYDYDMLFPKYLSMVFESLKIFTYAYQDRPISSLRPLTFACLCDSYLYSSDYFKKYAQKSRKTIVSRLPYNIGQWKSSFFAEAANIPLDSLSFVPNNNDKGNRFKKEVILVYGFFHDDSNIVTSKDAVDSFCEYVNQLAMKFSLYTIIVRMKILTPKLESILMENLKGNSNILLSTSYGINYASYRLAIEASLIVSVCSSIADDCLAYGKPVILINDYGTVDNVCTTVYPKQYHFLIALDVQDLILKVGSYFNNEPNIVSNYKSMFDMLTAPADFKGNLTPSMLLERSILKNMEKGY